MVNRIPMSLLALGLVVSCAPLPDEHPASAPQPALLQSTAAFNFLDLAGGRFVGLRARGGVLTPTDLQRDGAASLRSGLQLVLEDADGDRHSLPARITTSRRNAAGVMVHRAEFLDARAGGWRPLCRGGGEGVLIPGVTDEATGVHGHLSDAMTWACTEGALGRCTAAGYAYLDEVMELEFFKLFQACTRAVRADYCGDGVAHTRAFDGTPIDIYDTYGVVQPHTPSAGASGAVEATWSEDGARCIGTPPDGVRLPTCATALPACADHAPRGVVTRVP